MRRHRSNHKQNRNVFEQLETRLALAGNVLAALSGGALVITGDGSANVISVSQVSANAFKITGAGTKVNGSNSAQTVSGVTNGVFIDMQGGSDVLTLKNLNIVGSSGEIGLGVLLGSGNDALVMTSVNVDSGCGIDGGDGNNSIVIDKSTFNYDLGIQTYSGIDAVVITRSTVIGALSIQLGDGTNSLSMVTDKVLQETETKGSNGNELPEGFSVLEDAFFPIDCGVIITGGDGVDAITLNGVQIDCLTQIDTDGGVDSVTIVNSRFGNQIVLDDILPEDQGLCIETGLGSDAVSIVNTKVYGHLQIDTSDQIPCRFEITPSQDGEVENDGNDAVTLTKVDVLAAATELECVSWTEEYGWVNDGSLCGSLSIYTGNGIDAVTLASVNTDCEALIVTTDLEDSSLDGADAVAIANSSFNRNGIIMVPVQVETGGLNIFTGRGNDAVSIVKVKVVGSTDVETGDGTDAVTVNALAADAIYIDLGDGNYDVLTIVNSKASFAQFEGGGNTGDSLVKSNNHFNTENDLGFRFINGKPQL